MFCLKYHKMIKCLMKQSIVHCSNKCSFVIRNPKLTSEINLIRQALSQSHPPTTYEWRKLRDQLAAMQAENKSPVSVDVLVMACCLPTELSAGKSYMRHLTETGQEADLSASINLLKLYYRANKVGTEITVEDQREIVAMYEQFAEKFPIFDRALGEGLIYGLVLTANWRKSLDVLDAIKITSIVSPVVYTAIIERAIQEEDEPIVWDLMNDMVRNCKSLRSDAFVSYIDFCERNSDKFPDNINKMLAFIGDNQIIITTEIATQLHRVFQKFNYVCSIAAVTKSGKIMSSRKHFRNIHVSDDEFNHLSNYFLDKILIGNKSCGKATPNEFDSFVKFIDQTKPFDIVIDGLNVAYSTQKLKKTLLAAKILANVVKHFVDQNKRLLVIGRKHMDSWPKAQMNYIRSNAKLFLTENSSDDDPFFLYSTLKSGPQTDFVTRDLIRDYAYKLDDNLRLIFRQWQLQHQRTIQYISDTNGVIFRERIQFDMVAQQMDDCWYIPFENNSHCTFQLNNFDLRKNWLCVCRKEMVELSGKIK